MLLQEAEPKSSAALPMGTAAYLAHGILEKERAMELWQRIIKHEASSVDVLQAGSRTAMTRLVGQLMVQCNIYLGAPGKTRHSRGLPTLSRAADTVVSLQGLFNIPGGYLQQRKRLVALILRCASALRVAQKVAHTATSALTAPPTWIAKLLQICAILKASARVRD